MLLNSESRKRYFVSLVGKDSVQLSSDGRLKGRDDTLHVYAFFRLMESQHDITLFFGVPAG